MAEERITLRIGGEYSAKEAFTQVNSDVKDVQKSAKDMTQSFSNGLNNVAGMLDGQVANSVKGFSTLLRGLGSGGVFGLVTAAATATLSFIITKFNEARAAAAKFSEICRTGIVDAITAVSTKFKDVSTDIANAKADANSMLQVLNGATASEAQTKIHQLHIQTLQKITDGMSEAGKNAILANETYQAAIIKNTAAIEQAEATTKAANDTVHLMAQKREAAENALFAIQNQQMELETQMLDYGRGWFAEYQGVQERLKQNEENFANGLYDQAAFLKYNKDLKLQLAAIEEEHKNELTQYNGVLQMVKEATANVDAAKREEEAATRAVTIAQQNETNIRTQCATAYAEAEQKQKEANELLEQENSQKRAKIEQEELERASAQERLDLLEASAKAERTSLALNIDKNYMLEMFKELLGEGLTKQEAYNQITERINEIMNGRQQIEAVCAQNGIESAELMELFNESMYNGKTVTETYAELQKKLNDTIDGRIDAEEDAISGSKSKNDKYKGISISVSASSVADIGNEIERSVDDAMQSQETIMTEINDEARQMKVKQKDMMSAWRKETPFFNGYLSGRMPRELADKYVQKFVQKFPVDFIKKQAGEAMKEKMLSKSEQKTHMNNLKKLVKLAENAGLK